MKKKIAVVLCNDMHMDIERANLLLNYIAQDENYHIICDYTSADIVIIQTCAFGNGKKYSMQVIADVTLNAMPDARIMVTGCLVSINKEELEAIPNIEVKSFEELIDAHSEIRMPINYYNSDESSMFVLFNDKTAWVYVLSKRRIKRSARR